MSEAPEFVIEYTMKVDREGNLHADLFTPPGSSFADAYSALVAARDELQRLIAERRQCPHNPLHLRS